MPYVRAAGWELVASPVAQLAALAGSGAVGTRGAGDGTGLVGVAALRGSDPVYVANLLLYNLILNAARSPGFSLQVLEAALAAAEEFH